MDKRMVFVYLIICSEQKRSEGFDTDVTLAANSDEKVASQKAVKSYMDTANKVLQVRITKLEAQLIPGMIMAWKGSVGSIPAGWQLCEELKDKFVLGAGTDFKVGATGGEVKHTLTVDELPKHTHQFGSTVVLGGYESQEAVSSGYSVKSKSGFRTSAVGGNEPHNNMPPYYVLIYIEYVGELVAKLANASRGLELPASQPSIAAVQEVAVV